jgi:aldehyde dehydrogenase (NAD+)
MSVTIASPTVKSASNQHANEVEILNQIPKRIDELRSFFDTQVTKDVDFRIAQLKKLRTAMAKHERNLLDAVKTDLNKHEFEAFGTEIALVMKEIDTAIACLPKWAKAQKVGTAMFFFKASSYIINEPYGTTLIIAPWNYPIQLSLLPLVGAIAAGNCAVLKLSEWAPATSAAVAKLVSEALDPRHVAVFEGDIAVSQTLLKHKFDYIFFTGSTAVGKIVYEAAAKHLTPVTLELGGKSPCIVAADADIALTAKRIMWGKLVNAGQTCIAPDYLLVHSAVKDSLIAALKKSAREMYGKNAANSPYYPRIISNRHFKRLVNLLHQGGGDIVYGGETIEQERYLSPTLLDHVQANDPIMQEEIFGPILPILTYDTIEQAIRFVNERPKPLALYVFTHSNSISNRILHETSSGSACINDTLMQIGNANMPFGGVGDSGMGGYHGKFSFDYFSHQKSVMDRSLLIDPPVRYAPYRLTLSAAKMLLRRLM